MGSSAPFPFVRPPELDGEPVRRRPVVIIGSGPVGLTLAIDLAGRGVPVVVLDDNDVVSVGSRAICWAKRTLEIWDRLGVGTRMVDKGVTWNVGRVYHGDRELYSFDLLPEAGHRRPAFVNLQQYYVEQFLVERAKASPDLIDLRWRNEVTDIAPTDDGVRLAVSTPAGAYALHADWVVAADGARSPTRASLNLPFPGQTFEERFLIADVRMRADFRSERLFWFEPTFHPGQSALLHRQPDDVYRLDFQLGPEADPVAERDPERVMTRVRAVVGEDVEISLEWCSVYAFRCARLERFVHGRVVFVGDAAHVVSPFGARGGNSGVQDADNLAWKLARVVQGEAPESLIATYDEERGRGADENILNSSRTTNFMSPRSRAERQLRDGVLDLASRLPFARALVNGGRLSTPCSLAGLTLQTPDAASWPGGAAPGEACPDAPVTRADGSEGWLLDHLGGPFTLLLFATRLHDPAALAQACPGCALVHVLPPGARSELSHGATVLHDHSGLAQARYGAGSGGAYLVRPDAHVAARFIDGEPSALSAALARATGSVQQALLGAAE